jgi:hypothetical protein
MSSTPCIQCSRLNMRSLPEQEARKGYGQCSMKPKDVATHIERDVLCRDFRQMEAGQVQKRVVFWQQNK